LLHVDIFVGIQPIFNPICLNLPHFLTSSFPLSSFLPSPLPPLISSSQFHHYISHFISQKLLPSSLKKYCVRTTKAKVFIPTVLYIDSVRFQALTVEQYVARDVSLGGSADYLWVVIAMTWG